LLALDAYFTTVKQLLKSIIRLVPYYFQVYLRYVSCKDKFVITNNKTVAKRKMRIT